MSDAARSLASEIVKCLEETFEEVHGIYLHRGTSLLETLESVTAEQASRPIGAGGATVAAHVEHTAFYLEVLDEIVRSGRELRVDWTEIWKRVGTVSDAEWAALKSRLTGSYRSFRQAIETDSVWKGGEAVPGALAVLVHTAYHLGSIRQMLGIMGTEGTAWEAGTPTEPVGP